MTGASDRQRTLEKKARAYAKKLVESFQKPNYAKHESALGIAGDIRYQNQVKKKIAHLIGARHVVLIGIGGSTLGVEALQGALSSELTSSLLVLDSIDDQRMREYKHLLSTVKDVSDIAIVFTTKSGTTTETMTNGTEVLARAEEKFGEKVYSRMVFIGSDKSALAKIAKKKKITWIDFPDSIGGRYSVFSAVGIVPLTILGIDTQAFRRGAESAHSQEEIATAIRSAVNLVIKAEEGMHTLDLFTFNRQLTRFALWYRQLLAESIGKKTTKQGKPFDYPILPTVSSASDLHSVAQLYLSGNRGIYTHFIYTVLSNSDEKLPNHWLLANLPMLVNKSPRTIVEAIREGVIKAYSDEGLPYHSTVIPSLSPHEIGRLMAVSMIEVMILGHLFDVNAFDQPSIELYKSHTRSLLSE